MLPIISLLPRRLRRDDLAIVGDCLVCHDAVRERDDRMRVQGRYVHTGCAGYRLRSIARNRTMGAQPAHAEFTGD